MTRLYLVLFASFAVDALPFYSYQGSDATRRADGSPLASECLALFEGSGNLSVRSLASFWLYF